MSNVRPLQSVRAPLVTIRQALPSDAPSIQALYGELVSNPHVQVDPARVGQVGDDPNTGLFVAVQENAVIGTALVCLCADVMFRSQPFAVVENIVVSAAARGHGVGAALLEHIESFCAAAECSKIMFLSAAQRVETHRFFERSGFTDSSKVGLRQVPSPVPGGHTCRRLTPPSSGRAKGRFAPLAPPLMSNVRQHKCPSPHS